MFTTVANDLDAIDRVTLPWNSPMTRGFFEKLGEISGTEEFANKLDDLISILDSDDINEEELLIVSSDTFSLFNIENSWRKDANKNLLPELMKYNEVIKNNIGLRRQSKLTKEQAKFVARCNSVHRDVSLNF
mgnify:CR=1 FL=1